jgi:hypothetical protein
MRQGELFLRRVGAARGLTVIRQLQRRAMDARNKSGQDGK